MQWRHGHLLGELGYGYLGRPGLLAVAFLLVRLLIKDFFSIAGSL